MKEFRFNLKYLFTRKELYISFICILLVNLIHVFLVLRDGFKTGIIYEFAYTAEYKNILYNAMGTYGIVIVLVLPIACSMILGDSTWLDFKRKNESILQTRLNIKKLVVSRWFLSFIVPFVFSFIGFFANYITLVSFMGTGHRYTFVLSMPYALMTHPAYFLDSLRLDNPVLFTVIIFMHVSLILGLLSSITYSFSLFSKNRIGIYFIVPSLMILFEVVLSVFNLSPYSIVVQLFPASFFTLTNAITLYIVLFAISLVLLCGFLRKKDILL